MGLELAPILPNQYAAAPHRGAGSQHQSSGFYPARGTSLVGTGAARDPFAAYAGPPAWVNCHTGWEGRDYDCPACTRLPTSVSGTPLGRPAPGGSTLPAVAPAAAASPALPRRTCCPTAALSTTASSACGAAPGISAEPLPQLASCPSRISSSRSGGRRSRVLLAAPPRSTGNGQVGPPQHRKGVVAPGAGAGAAAASAAAPAAAVAAAVDEEVADDDEDVLMDEDEAGQQLVSRRDRGRRQGKSRRGTRG